MEKRFVRRVGSKRSFYYPADSDHLFNPKRMDDVFINDGFNYKIETLNEQLYVVISPRPIFTSDGINYDPDFAKSVHTRFLGNPAIHKYKLHCEAFEKIVSYFGAKITIGLPHGESLLLETTISISVDMIKNVVEPQIDFGGGKTHSYPAAGIKNYHPLDYNLSMLSHPSEIKVAFIGTGFTKDLLNQMCRGSIKFRGFTSVYKTKIAVGDRKVILSDEDIAACKSVEDVTALLLKNAVIVRDSLGLDVCVVELVPQWEQFFIGQDLDLRDYIKVRFWKERISTQVITRKAVEASAGLVLDNIALGIYVAAGGRPWRLEDRIVNTAFIGIAFGDVVDNKSRLIGIAEIFDEYGQSIAMTTLAVREEDRDVRFFDKDYHLSQEQFSKVMITLLEDYKIKMGGNYPEHIIIHKTSAFDDAEKAAVDKFADHPIEFTLVHICSGFANLWSLITDDKKEPRRGCYWRMSEDKSLIYTSGILQNLPSYAFPGIPIPMVLIKQDNSPISIDEICKQVILLTKLNWNSTNSYEREPVTISHARKIVDLLRAGLDPFDIPNDIRFFI
jgi:hypothetical protein